MIEPFLDYGKLQKELKKNMKGAIHIHRVKKVKLYNNL